MSLVRFGNRLGVHLACAAYRLRYAAAGVAAVAAVLASSGDAHAQGGPVTPTGKGIVGGALLGGEVVVIPMGLAGVQKGWPYFVFGGVGMVGGAVGGYFVEKATAVTTNSAGVSSGGPAEPALYMLAGGLALVIPALVISLNATAYHPPESDRQEPANNEPARDAPKPDAAPGAVPPAGGASQTPGATSYVLPRRRGEVASLPHLPMSLFDMYKGKVSLAVPVPQIRPLYTEREMWQYGVAQGTEVRVPVFKAMF